MKAKKRVSWFVTPLVLAVAGYGAYTYFSRPAKVTFLKAAVTKGPVESVVSATGTLSATRLVPVGSQVSGRVMKMHADYNTVVRKGDLLAEIDQSIFQNTLEQRTAALRSAETQRLQAEVAEARADVDISNAEVNVKNQQLAVARAKSAADEAKRKWELQKNAADAGIATRDSEIAAKVAYEQAVLNTESAEAQLRTSEGSLAATKAQRRVVATQRITAESQIAQARGQLTDAELNLSYTRIVSPVDGIVINRKLNEGETVAASMTTPQLFEIAQDLTEMHLDTNIDESDISRVQVGQPATFTVDAFPGQTFRGEVIQIRRGAINVQNVISYTVVVNVDNSDQRLFPGMTANTRIITDRVENTLRIPSSALRFRPPTDLTVVGDVGGGKGKGGFKDGGKDNAKETSSVEPLKEETKAAPVNTRPDSGAKETARAELKDNSGDGKGGRRGKGGNFDPSQFKGKGGNFDPSQFRGADGQIDREALRAQFQAKGGFDPSQFQGRGGRGGNGGGRGAAAGRGGAAVQQVQTVYLLNAKNEVEAVRVRTGLSDGNWVQLINVLGDGKIEEGTELVTAVDGLPSQTNTKGNPQGGNQNFKGNQGFPGGGGFRF